MTNVLQVHIDRHGRGMWVYRLQPGRRIELLRANGYFYPITEGQSYAPTIPDWPPTETTSPQALGPGQKEEGCHDTK